MAGYIKLYRKLLENLVFKNEKALKVFIWCLLKASYTDNEQMVGFQKITLQPGQFIFRRSQAAEELGMAESTLYRCMMWLVSEGILDIKSNNKFSIVTIVNWALYQLAEPKMNSKVNNKRTANEQQDDIDNINISNNIDNINNKVDINNNKNKKKEKKDKNNIYNAIFEHWNSKKIIVHQKLTDEFKKDIDKALKQSSLEEIIKAIDHYAEAYHDPKYEYCKYKWGIHEFLTRKEGYKRFLDDGAKWLNYLRHKNNQQTVKPKSRYREE